MRAIGIPWGPMGSDRIQSGPMGYDGKEQTVDIDTCAVRIGAKHFNSCEQTGAISLKFHRTKFPTDQPNSTWPALPDSHATTSNSLPHTV